MNQHPRIIDFCVVVLHFVETGKFTDDGLLPFEGVDGGHRRRRMRLIFEQHILPFLTYVVLIVFSIAYTALLELLLRGAQVTGRLVRDMIRYLTQDSS